MENKDTIIDDGAEAPSVEPVFKLNMGRNGRPGRKTFGKETKGGLKKRLAEQAAELAALRKQVEEKTAPEGDRKELLDMGEPIAVDSPQLKDVAQGEPHAESIEELRRGRKPLDGADRLTAEQIPGYHIRFVNDTPGNVDRFLAAGYRPVKAKRGERMFTGVRRTGDGNPIQGSIIETSVGTGVKAILMQLPLELYEQDMRSMDDRTEATESGIKLSFANKARDHNHETGNGSVYGDVKITRSVIGK